VPLVLLAALCLAVWWTARRSRPPVPAAAQMTQLPPSPWRAAHYLDPESGVTVVVVRRVATRPDGTEQVVDEHRVATVPEDDESWEALFGEAMAAARSRATFLNVEDGLA
jgi:hypothetical protein